MMAANQLSASIMPATAANIMNTAITVVQSTDTIGTAIELISSKRHHMLPIVDAQQRFLGEISVHSLLTRILPNAALRARGVDGIDFMQESIAHLRSKVDEVRHEPVTHAMCRDARIVSPDTPLLQTLLVLCRSRQSVAVVDSKSGKLHGMVSYFDVEKNLIDGAVRSAGTEA